MPRAGFYAIESRRIRFGRDGRWYSDDEPIANAKIAALFSRSIRRSPAGGYQLQMGDEKAAIEVDDTPYVVTGIEGDEADGFRVVLNDDTRAPLEAETLRAGPDNALYCRVKDTEEARFLRPAYYALAPWIVADGDAFALRMRGRRFPIRPRSTGPG